MTCRKRIAPNAARRWTETATTFRLKPSSASRAIKARISTSIFPASISRGRINTPRSFSAHPTFLKRARLLPLPIRQRSALSKSILTTTNARFQERRKQGSQSAVPALNVQQASIRAEWWLFRMPLRRRISLPFSTLRMTQARVKRPLTLTSMRFTIPF